jgi:exopolysaccharide production protein ExoZ
MHAPTRLVFIPRLEALRGIAAVSVVGYHCTAHITGTYVTGLGPVVLFFVLSGFVLARSLSKDADPFNFIRHRLLRLLPAATATVLLFSALYLQFGFYVGYTCSVDPLNVVLNSLMIKSDINPTMWSMTVECFATPLILLSFLMFQKRGDRPLVILIALLFGLSFIGPYAHLLGGVTNLAPLYAFVAGVLLHFRGRVFVERLRGLESGAAIAALVLFCFCGTRKQTSPILLLECLSSAMVIALIAFGPTMRLWRPLDAAIVRFYGRISYSFYLLHMIGVALAITMIGDWPLPTLLLVIGSFVLSIAIATPLAWIFWRFIEIPFISLGKKTQPAPDISVFGVNAKSVGESRN